MNSFLFNFSSSYSGGGLKRLLAYLKWFDDNGGGYFIINHKAKSLLPNSKHNVCYYISPSKVKKALNNQDYLIDITNQIGTAIDFYYSYGIPIPYKVGRVNWFHLSNVLPLIGHSGYGIPWGRSIELKWLGYLIKRSYKNVEVLSSESNYSLSLFPSSLHCSFVVSPNGSDEEVELFGLYTSRAVDNVAVVVGTFFYKDLNSSYSIFIELQKTTPDLMLVIIGDQSSIPSIIKDDKRVEAVGNLSHEQVIDLLSSARFYINTSKVENSWNSASEGVLLAQESFISNIEPHMELADIVTRRRYVEYNNILHISRQSVVPDNLPVWSVLISNMVNFIKLKKYV